MIGILKLLLYWVAACFKSDERLEAENTYLRHQLVVLRRKAPRKIMLTNWERFVFVWLYRLRPGVLLSTHIVDPNTVLRWHRNGFRAYWRRRSYNPGGRPHIERELRQLIREMSVDNPLWGAPRIHGELLKLGFDVSQSTVAKYMIKGIRPPSQSWRTFLKNHADGIAAVDLLVVPSISFELLYCLVIIHHRTRRLLHFGVTQHPTSEWVAQQVRQAFPWDQAPEFLIRDNDAVYGVSFVRCIQSMGIRDRPTAFRSRCQNAYVERGIGSIRRECLDHVIVLGEAHLRRVLKSYVDYYNRSRTHLSLNKDSPIPRHIQRSGTIKSLSVLGGLHHQYCRIE